MRSPEIIKKFLTDNICYICEKEIGIKDYPGGEKFYSVEYNRTNSEHGCCSLDGSDKSCVGSRIYFHVSCWLNVAGKDFVFDSKKYW